MKRIFTSLAPNTQADDALYALRLLFQPWRWRRGSAAKELETRVSARIGVPYAISTESGRSALYTLLVAAGIKEGDEVLVQSYTCVAAVAPILWVGATPVYVDVDATLTMSAADFEKKVTSRAKAVIIQHTFGVPANLTGLLALATTHSLFVIEDCAHALGSAFSGKPLGSFGDAAFFSFGRDKSISGVFGGMVVTKHADLAQKISNIVSEYPLPGYIWIKRQLLHPIIFSLARATYHFGGALLIMLTKHLRITSKVVYPEERAGKLPPFAKQKMANALALLILHQLTKLDVFTAHRKRIGDIYEKMLPPSLNRQLTNQAADQSSRLRYTIQVPNPLELHRCAKEKGISLGDWYDTGIAPRGVSYEAIGYNPHLCPNAEQYASHSINLPTDIHICDADAIRISNLINDYSKHSA